MIEPIEAQALAWIAWTESGGALEQPKMPGPYPLSKALVAALARVAELTEEVNSLGYELRHGNGDM